jgi:sialic acid synthase SpsE
MSAAFDVARPDGSRLGVGGDAPCLIIAEIGTNWHQGTSHDDSLARRLIDVAAETGCDAVKFQTYQPEKVYVPNPGMSDYLSAAGIRRSILEVIAERVMPLDMIPRLAAHAAERNVLFMSSCFSLDDIEAIDPHVVLHKLASYEISHLRLIDALAATGKPLLMSTGASAPDDIAWSVERYRASGGRDLALLQCTAAYPAPDAAMNLRAIPWLAETFHCAAGLSDHSPHAMHAPLAAVALGAKVIEKHITHDRTAAGPDHFNAVEPRGLAAMVAGIRAVEAMRGDGVKRIEPAEDELFAFARRRVQAIRDIAEGGTFAEGVNIDVLRPGKQRPGAHPRDLDAILGGRAARAIPQGDGVTRDDIRSGDM